MKFATRKNRTRDGELLLVSRDLSHGVSAADIAPTLQAALDDWEAVAPALSQRYDALNAGRAASAFVLDSTTLTAPLPRAYQWADGSAYLVHSELVRAARGALLDEELWQDPLMYQGGSDTFLGPRDDVALESESWGIDLEGEIAVITGDVPMGSRAEHAGRHIRLLMLVNDVSLRALVPAEIKKGFGFFQSKPSTAFSPVAVTPDELGDAWDGARLHLPLTVQVNGAVLGTPHAGTDMVFDFPRLVSHAAKSRALGAGTVIGSGTVSNADRSVGSACLAERRALETVRDGAPVTPFLRFGDRMRVEMFDASGQSIFGAIDQRVVQYVPPAS
ncbi:fumarylacetoacetate hydrolase family protein [Paraburkholderia sediminicola]|uniref:fumarylacetoacetate hydrolase family protein n=1 Tax=Paraburkholderia sediminicola TaxID=458836 RepID=UPI0038BDF85F